MKHHRTDVDGVPTIWAPADGEMRAGLVFRVGRADETLARGGITHLIEHLALHRVEQADLHFNGATSPTTTTFYVHGDALEVTRFFGTVCHSLHDLPVDRLDTEKAVLRTEAARPSHAALDQLLTWRYGPRGYGLPAYRELGLDEFTADDVRAWAQTWFSRENAAMWIYGGPPPPGLRLDLPTGRQMPLPSATAALPRLPAYFTARTNGIALDAIVPRSSASSIYTQVLNRRLHARLRRDLGISYEAQAAYNSRDAETATMTALADALPERNADVCREFVNILIDLARHEVPGEELAAVRERFRRSLFDPAIGLPWLVGTVDDLLVGVPLRDRDELWERLSAVAATDVLAVGQQVLDTGLALVPHGQAIGRAGFAAAPTGSAAALEGQVYAPVGAPKSRRRLIVSEDGLSITEGLAIATVRYADCVAMLAWPDGARMFYAPDAVTVRLEPQLWELPPDVFAHIDAAIPADRTVRLPARDPGSIPQPPKPTAEPTTQASSPDLPTTTTAPPKVVFRWRSLRVSVALCAIVLAAIALRWQTGSTVVPVAVVVFLVAFVRVVAPARARARARARRSKS